MKSKNEYHVISRLLSNENNIYVHECLCVWLCRMVSFFLSLVFFPFLQDKQNTPKMQNWTREE